MTFHVRRTVVVVLGLTLLASAALLPAVLAQPPLPRQIPFPALPGMPFPGRLPTRSTAGDKDSGEYSHALNLPTNDNLKSRIPAAEGYIKAKEWRTAVEQLQKLLDLEQDDFIPVTRKDNTGKEGTVLLSARAEAARLLGSMPEEGREFYRNAYGAAARHLLAKAREEGDPSLLAEVSRRYLYTDAGVEATLLRAAYDLDRGRYAVAALCYERLLERQEHDKLPVSALVHAALAFRRIGDRKREDEVWKQLTVRSGNNVRIGDKAYNLSDLRDAVAHFKDGSPEFSRFDWAMYRGNPSRSADADGGAPFLEKRWARSTFREGEQKQTLRSLVMDQAVKLLESRTQPVLPAFFPIAADGKVVYRSYWGIHAIDLKTGKLKWESPARWSLEMMAEDDSKRSYATQWANQYLSMGKPSWLFENSTVGTLSTDNQLVYTVDDLSVLPVQNLNYGGGGQLPVAGLSGEIADAVYHNKLAAYELRSGKLKWTLGGRADKGDLGDTYFLGPPLPLHGKLYVLTEKNQELRLVCLDPSDVSKPVWSQKLAETQIKLLGDSKRRTQAVHLAYGEGILVCPTNAGALLGVDLLSHSLVWLHPYRKRGSAEPIEQELIRRRYGQPSATSSSEWKTSAPVVLDGKVVFTAPDGDAIHCLNLRDGSLVWAVPRTEEDLYLAGVFRGKVVVVGRKTARAYAVADGKQVWAVETGLPSGQGVAAENLYFLPLKSAVASKQPEVCAIDIDKGVVFAHTRSRKNEVPGNLLLHDGDVLSQSVSDVAVFPQLKVKLAQIDALLARKPTDPDGLTGRADLNLDRGDHQGAVDDLRTALANQPSPDTRERARNKLHECLTEYLRKDFKAAEKYLEEYRALCTIEVAAAAGDTERKEAAAETKRRRANYLALLARGREQQRRFSEAFDAYLEFGTLAARDELLSVVDEPTVKAPADVWAQGRIAALRKQASKEEWAPLEQRIAQRWEQVKNASDIEELRRFVALFGSEFVVGREARLLFAERLMEGSDNANLLEAERQFLLLRQQDDRTLAARGVDGLARLLARRGNLEDAAHYYRVLGRDFAQVVVRDGKTGEALLNELATDKRFLPYVDEPGAVWGKVKVSGRLDHTGNFSPPRQLYTFEPATGNEQLPFFRRHRVALNTGQHQFVLAEQASGREVWSRPLTRAPFPGLTYPNPLPTGPRFPYRSVGHLIVLTVGTMVYGIDPISQKVLWEKPLLPSALSGQQNITTDPADGGLQVLYTDGYTQKVGQLGPVEASHVCLHTGEALVALEPVTGRELWKRTDVSARSQLFGDGLHVFVVEMTDDNRPSRARALRAQDGATVEVPDFAALYSRRQRIIDGQLLVWESAGPRMTLGLYAVPSGQWAWRKEFSTGSILLQSEVPHLAGVVEPDGKVSVFDVRTQRAMLNARLDDPKHVEKAQGVTLLGDRRHLYLAVNGPAEANAGIVTSNFIGTSGLRSVPVNGVVYGFDRETGKRVYRLNAPILNQMLVLDQFADLPVLLFTSRHQRGNNGFRGFAIGTQAVSLQCFDKRTGLEQEGFPDLGMNSQPFTGIHTNLREGKIELVSPTTKVTYTITDSPVK